MSNQIQSSNEMPKQVRHDQRVILNSFQSSALDSLLILDIALLCLRLVSQDPDQTDRSTGIVRSRRIADRDDLLHFVFSDEVIYLFIQDLQFLNCLKDL